LDYEIISGCSLAGFKRKLDHHFRDQGIYKFRLSSPISSVDELDSLAYQVQVHSVSSIQWGHICAEKGR